jgi:hypothetical protein
MCSPPASPNGSTPRRGTLAENARHAGLMTRLVFWLVNVATPRLIPDYLIAPLRRRARQSDDQLERAARRLTSRLVNRAPANPDRHTR